MLCVHGFTNMLGFSTDRLEQVRFSWLLLMGFFLKPALSYYKVSSFNGSHSNLQLSFGFPHCLLIGCSNNAVAEKPTASICG